MCKDDSNTKVDMGHQQGIYKSFIKLARSFKVGNKDGKWRCLRLEIKMENGGASAITYKGKDCYDALLTFLLAK